MSTNELTWERYSGYTISNYVFEVAKFRIKYFRDFPYFYDGNLEYELNYLKGYSEDEKSILIIIRNSQKEIVAVSTGIPLITKSDILSDAEIIFSKNGFNPRLYYYYGEVILDYSVRSQGLTRLIYDDQDKYAQKHGFESIAVATVVREAKDSRNVNLAPNSDYVWRKLGFIVTTMTFNCIWPTIQLDGTTIDCENEMVFWIKDVKGKL